MLRSQRCIITIISKANAMAYTIMQVPCGFTYLQSALTIAL
jgi:hypothetical protein